MLGSPGMASLLGSLECTPGYYNNEGQPPTAASRYNFLGYPGGPSNEAKPGDPSMNSIQASSASLVTSTSR